MTNEKSQDLYFHVIMAWGADPEHAIKKAAIVNAAKSAGGMEPRFPDYVPSQPSFSLNALINELKGAAFVLADLSLARPSCYYELGVAEAVGVELYVIAKTGTEIHQTSHRKSIITYHNTEGLARVVHRLLLDKGRR